MDALILCSSNDDFALTLLQCLGLDGTRCWVFSGADLPAAFRSRHCHGHETFSREEFHGAGERLVGRILEKCARDRVGLLIAADMTATYLLSRVKERVPPETRCFPTADQATLKKLHDKWAFAQFLRENRLPLPETRLLESAEQAATWGMGFPVVVKPVERGSRLGVRVLGSRQELEAHARSDRPENRPPLIVQEYIPGEDIDLNVLAENGSLRAWSVQKWIREGDTLQFVDQEEVVEIGRKVAAAARFHGIAHFDMRIDSRDGRVKVIECNPRVWGSLRASQWNGIDFIRLGIRIAEGKALPEEHPNRKVNYRLPSKLLADLRRGKLSALWGTPACTWRDLARMLADPVASAAQIRKKIAG